MYASGFKGDIATLVAPMLPLPSWTVAYDLGSALRSAGMRCCWLRRARESILTVMLRDLSLAAAGLREAVVGGRVRSQREREKNAQEPEAGRGGGDGNSEQAAHKQVSSAPTRTVLRSTATEQSRRPTLQAA